MFRTSRGGLITFHGPGQLVVYPIFDLRSISSKPLGVRKYVDNLEQVKNNFAENLFIDELQVIIDTATEFGISRVGRTENTGKFLRYLKTRLDNVYLLESLKIETSCS